jgi:hypothetical protein
MLSGQSAFRRDTAAETMTAVLRDDVPEFTGTSVQIPPALDHIIRRRLEKDPVHRFQSARDLSFAMGVLSGGDSSGSQSAAAAVPPVARRSSMRIGLLALGKVMFYLSPTGMLIAVPIIFGQAFASGTPAPLFQVRGRAAISSTDLFTYDVTRDGQRFIVNEYLKPQHIEPLVIVQNALSDPPK